MRSLLSLYAASCAIILTVRAHGDHGSGDRPADWASYHLQEEHHISNFDAASFFSLHDFNGDGVWTSDEVRKFYGLDDASLKDIAPETKHLAVKKVMSLYDVDSTGSITRDAFVRLNRQGVQLPDFNLGPGHHGDIEYEYEIHHFEKFHAGDPEGGDLLHWHPEDIEHFALHDHLEEEEERVANEQSQGIVEANIPIKFRVQT